MLSVSISFAFASGLGFPAAAQDSSSVSLDYASAQQRFVQRSDAIQASEANLRSKEAQERSTRNLHAPDLDFELQLLDYQKTLYLPLGSLAPLAGSFSISDPLKFSQERTSTRPIITATIPLYTGGQIEGTQAGARAQVTQAEAERGLAVESGLLQLTQAYYGQQLAERALGVRLDVLKGLQHHVEDVEKLESEGLATRAQKLQAQVARDEAEREYQSALSALATANVSLAGLLRAPEGVRPTSPLFVISTPLEPLDGFVAAAVSQHPQLIRSRSLSEQARAGVTVQGSKLQPQVYGFAQYNFDPRDALLTDPDWAIGVGVRYKFFSGLDRGQAVEAAQQLASQASAGEREVRTQIQIGVTRAWFEVEAARKRFLLLESSLASSEESLRLQGLAFREQQATSLDVIDAQLSVGRSRIQQAQAAYDYVTAIAQLLHVSGQMTRLPDYLSRADRIVP